MCYLKKKSIKKADEDLVFVNKGLKRVKIVWRVKEVQDESLQRVYDGLGEAAD